MVIPMNDQYFSIGEIAIYWRPESPYHLVELVICSNLTEHYVYDCVTKADGKALAYEVNGPLETPPYGVWVAEPRNLRKKPEGASWSACAWQPKQVNA